MASVAGERKSGAGVQGHRGAIWGLRLLGAASLGVSGVLHVMLAPTYGITFGLGPAGIGLGTAFLLQGLASLGAAVLLLALDRRLAWVVAGTVALVSLVAALVSVYAPVPSLGPLPPLGPQPWFSDLVVAAVSEAVTVAAWAGREALGWRKGARAR